MKSLRSQLGIYFKNFSQSIFPSHCANFPRHEEFDSILYHKARWLTIRRNGKNRTSCERREIDILTEFKCFWKCRVIFLPFYPFDRLSSYCYDNNVMSICHHHNNHYYPLYNHRRYKICSYSNSSLILNDSWRSSCLPSPRTRSAWASTECSPCDWISLGCGMSCAESYFLVICFVVRYMLACTVRVLIAVHQCCVMNADHDSNTNCFLHSNYSNLCSFSFWSYSI